jgi:hypothetical protein
MGKVKGEARVSRAARRHVQGDLEHPQCKSL